jgi:hypothetical protein
MTAAKRATILSAILVALPLWVLAQSRPGEGSELQAGKILSVQAHEEGRPFDWIGRSAIPIYDHYPFYDLTVALNWKTYVVRYESQTGYFPAAWKPGSVLQVRLGRGRLYLVRYDGEEVPASIIRTSLHRP